MSRVPIAADIAEELQQGQDVKLQLSPFSVFTLIGLLQLTCRHPRLPPNAKLFAQQLARDLERQLSEGRPETAKGVQLGWQQKWDRKL